MLLKTLWVTANTKIEVESWMPEAGSPIFDLLLYCLLQTKLLDENNISENIFASSRKLKTTGTNKEPGTGLGLMICKEFAGLNNGRIWVESEQGKGSTFSFSLPVAP